MLRDTVGVSLPSTFYLNTHYKTQSIFLLILIRMWLQQLWNNLHRLVSVTAALINCFSTTLTNASGCFFPNALRAWGKTVLHVINLIFFLFFKAVITSADYFIMAVGRKLMSFTAALTASVSPYSQIPPLLTRFVPVPARAQLHKYL